MSAVLQFNGLTLELLASNSCMAWLEDEDTEAGQEPASALPLARPQEQEQAGRWQAEPLGKEPGATLGGLAMSYAPGYHRLNTNLLIPNLLFTFDLLICLCSVFFR